MHIAGQWRARLRGWSRWAEWQGLLRSEPGTWQGLVDPSHTGWVLSPSTSARAAGSLIFFDTLLQGLSQDIPNASTSLGGPRGHPGAPHPLAPIPRDLQMNWSDPGQLLSSFPRSRPPFLTVLGADPSAILLFCHLENILPEAQVSRAASPKPRPSCLIPVLPAGTWIFGGPCCEGGESGSHRVQFLYGADGETGPDQDTVPWSAKEGAGGSLTTPEVFPIPGSETRKLRPRKE